MKLSRHLALEEDSSGQTKGEQERTYYARLENMTALMGGYNPEEHEQWEIKIPKTDTNETPGRIRVRQTKFSDGRIEIVQTIKINRPDSEMGHSSVDETSQAVTADVFEQFKRMATSGMKKVRYHFALPPHEGSAKHLEVDVFKMPNGKTANWVKIDYEYGPNEADHPLSFPPGFVDVIAGDSEDPEDRETIQELYNTIFLSKG